MSLGALEIDTIDKTSGDGDKQRGGFGDNMPQCRSRLYLKIYARNKVLGTTSKYKARLRNDLICTRTHGVHPMELLSSVIPVVFFSFCEPHPQHDVPHAGENARA